MFKKVDCIKEKENAMKCDEEMKEYIEEFDKDYKEKKLNNKIENNEEFIVENKKYKSEHYYGKRLMSFHVENGKLHVNTNESNFSDYDYNKHDYTGEYKLTSVNGFFKTELNKNNVENLINFLNDIKDELD